MQIVSKKNEEQQLTGTMAGQSRAVGIEDPSFIIELLGSGLYSYPIRTLVQEYISNAIDANRESGSSETIAITIPTQFDPVFKVRDFGPGMDEHRYEKVFLNLGNSTKRDTNDQVGGFGIGSKSFISYTDSMIITIFHNGMKRVENLHLVYNPNTGKNDLKSKEIETLRGPTDEPNGVEIAIAVEPSDIREFKKAIFRRTFFVQGHEFKYLGIPNDEVPTEFVTALEVTKKMSIVNKAEFPEFFNMRYANNKIALLVDGVLYPVDNEYYNVIPGLKKSIDILKNNQLILLRIGNGVVQLAASREEVKQVTLTTNFFKRAARYMDHFLKKKLESGFCDVANLESYVETFQEMSEKYDIRKDSHLRHFGDYSFPNDSSTLHHPALKAIKQVRHYIRDYQQKKRTDHNYSSTISIKSVRNKKYFYSDLPADEDAKTTARRIKHYFEEVIGGSRGREIIILKRDHYSESYTELEPVLDENDKPRTNADGTPMMRQVSRIRTRPVEEAKFQQILKDINARPLSELPIPPRKKSVRKKYDKIDRAKELFCVHKFCLYRGKDSEWISSETNKQKWIYVKSHRRSYQTETINDKRVREDELNTLASYLYETDSEYKVCMVSESNMKNIEGDTNFITLQEYVDKFTDIDPKVIRSRKDWWVDRSANSQYRKFMQLLEKMGDLIDEPRFVRLRDEYSEYRGTRHDAGNVPTFLLDKLGLTYVDSHPKLRGFQLRTEKIEKMISKQYPLMQHINAAPKEEICWYINNRRK